MSLYPLESNPDFMSLVGVPDRYKIVDVYGLDSDALAWIPRPVLAMILLFPCSEKYYEHVKKEKELVEDRGQAITPSLWFMKQKVSNACGTIALIHSLANNADRIELNDGIFKKLLEECAEKTPEERGEMLSSAGSGSEAFKLISAHQELAMEGQTEVNPNEQVNHHFIAFIEKDGELYELDGRKEFPINHGPTTKDTFVEDAARVCKAFIERDSEDINFTIMALVEADF
ncbi:ubiquitin carboxyl-terminal hydrolase isoform X2 [Leptinotarsa decemlineata]|uniref:ubiquitin carboxyl-terminal hydrolase isoform X2 n=1 Tax=Leptinotarsa decemlineata TaxID=7539 RepID=UPI003D306DCB